ncbi:hypothetical protein DRN74_00275 [Candidatus Micrarchaeota archaeon]|nr:MAG: hypothetical protein DRN74_00275 [Candidatus Micrarchaeota archaeon]
MVLCVKVRKKDAEKTRKHLVEIGVFDKRYKTFFDSAYVYFPIKDKVKGYETVEKKLKAAEQSYFSLEEALKDRLSEDELSKLTKSFDIIGDIAVIEIGKGLERYEKDIAEAIMKVHKHVKTVCKRAGKHGGVFRIRPVEVIGGDKRTLTEHKESGARMLVDVNKVYFTPRLSHERERIASQVKAGERIAYFFAGVGPFALVIGKKQKNVKIYAIELNPEAYRLLVKNISLNHMENIIIPIKGDVSVAYKRIAERCDRIIMPLPEGARHFLKYAFKIAKADAVVHYYQFAPKDNAFEYAEEIVKEEADKEGIAFKIINKRIARPYSPSTVQVVLDIKLLKADA